MNAIAYHPSTGIVDLVGGVKDVEARILRCVGDPDLRFQEDALRKGIAQKRAFSLDIAILSTLSVSKALDAFSKKAEIFRPFRGLWSRLVLEKMFASSASFNY